MAATRDNLLGCANRANGEGKASERSDFYLQAWLQYAQGECDVVLLFAEGYRDIRLCRRSRTVRRYSFSSLVRIQGVT